MSDEANLTPKGVEKKHQELKHVAIHEFTQVIRDRLSELRIGSYISDAGTDCAFAEDLFTAAINTEVVIGEVRDLISEAFQRKWTKARLIDSLSNIPVVIDLDRLGNYAEFTPAFDLAGVKTHRLGQFLELNHEVEKWYRP